jgi:rhodanese-related sulfurtransferase
VGLRSKETFDMMKEMGFSKIHNVLGGILEWINKDLPLDFSK